MAAGGAITTDSASGPVDGRHPSRSVVRTCPLARLSSMLPVHWDRAVHWSTLSSHVLCSIILLMSSELCNAARVCIQFVADIATCEFMPTSIGTGRQSNNTDILAKMLYMHTE